MQNPAKYHGEQSLPSRQMYAFDFDRSWGQNRHPEGLLTRGDIAGGRQPTPDPK